MKKFTHLALAVFGLFISIQGNAQQFFFSSEKPATCAANDGIITIVPTQGTPPFTYLWSNGSTDLSIRNVQKGTFWATLTDATGATIAHSHILNSEELDVQLTDYLPSSYCNPTSGKLTVDPIGGVAPYSFTWSNGQTTASATGLAVGTYGVTVVDAAGCSAVGEYSVGLPHGQYYPYASISATQQPDCANLTGGELTAGILYSGYEPYSFLWNNGATTESISGIAEGSFSVVVTDALGCSSTAIFDLKKAITMTGSTICTGQNIGTASAALVGATPPVSYLWNNGLSGPSISNLADGNYSVIATDANGCQATGFVKVAIPSLSAVDSSPKCYSGNNGTAYCYPVGDQATSFLWDNGSTESNATQLSPGLHSVTVTTSLGCTLTESISIASPLAPEIQITTNPTPADCANSLGGAVNASISGGILPYQIYAWGPNGFFGNSLSSLQNVAAGQYSLTVYGGTGGNCYHYSTLTVTDAGGFNPELTFEDLDCDNGNLGSAAILNVTAPAAAYNWSMGATTPDVYSLTAGCYQVTVTGGGTCQRNFEFCVYGDKDSLQLPGLCGGVAIGTLFNDLGAAGCAGTVGIPHQLFRTQPSGALNLTDDNGAFSIELPTGPFEIEPVQYDLADIACPAAGFYAVNIPNGSIQAGLDFHFLNANPVDHRVEQRPLRTAQPGYPFSVRYKVCNDGAAPNPGSLSLDYANFFGSISTTPATWFSKHPAAFSLTNETSGSPENHAQFGFGGVQPAGCELLQADFLTPNLTPAATQFLTRATVSPASGDPTPNNNSTTLFNTVMGSFDPNAVYAFPARNGNPHDGGDLLQNVDKTITYQVFFQNTGSAAANTVIVKDTLDAALNIESLRGISASHDVKIEIGGSNNVLVFKFPNINLPDSTTDFANSIGSIQYEIDLKPGLAPGTEIRKSAAIYFDFNPPVITNENVLKIAEPLAVKTPSAKAGSLNIFPNPASDWFRFMGDEASQMSIFNALGELVFEQKIAAGLHEFDASDLPSGIYIVRLNVAGAMKSGKLVVQR